MIEAFAVSTVIVFLNKLRIITFTASANLRTSAIIYFFYSTVAGGAYVSLNACTCVFNGAYVSTKEVDRVSI